MRLLPDEIVSHYFNAWRTHDLAALRRIVSPSILYNIQGLRQFTGWEQVGGYWERNAKRQRNLFLHYEIKDRKGNHLVCQFLAEFDDVEERERQSVHGQMIFEIRDGVISSFTESYSIYRKKTSKFLTKIQDIKRASGRKISNWSRRTFTRWGRRLVILTFFTMVACFLFGIYLYANILPTPLAHLSADVRNAKPQDIQAQTRHFSEAVRELLGYVSGFLGTIIALYELVRRKFKSDPDLQIFEIENDGDDLAIMNRFMTGAKHVTIFSGDFDFLGKSNDLCNTLMGLAEWGRLKVISDFTREYVRSQSKWSKSAVALLDLLEISRHISYGSDLHIRCSLITRETGNTILCYYKAVEDGRSAIRICAIHEEGRTKELCYALSKLSHGIIEKMREHVPVVDVNHSLAVVITGETKSGKTTLAKALQEHRFYIIRASEVVAQLAEGRPSKNRAELLEIGNGFITTEGQKAFGEALIGRAFGITRVIFDGVRLPEAIEVIRGNFDKTVVVFLEADRAIRRERFERENDRSVSFETMSNHPVETCGLSVRAIADPILDGSQPTAVNLRRVLSKIERISELD